jgi:hypothetical protein
MSSDDYPQRCPVCNGNSCPECRPDEHETSSYWLPAADLPRVHAVHVNAQQYKVARFPAVMTLCGRDIPLPAVTPTEQPPRCRQCEREVAL